MKKELTNFQKELEKALTAQGWTSPYLNTWQKPGYPDINVRKIENHEDLLKTLIEAGECKAKWDIQKALGL
jgi:hypothetical protein